MDFFQKNLTPNFWIDENLLHEHTSGTCLSGFKAGNTPALWILSNPALLSGAVFFYEWLVYSAISKTLKLRVA